jgi:hypothetical protein
MLLAENSKENSKMATAQSLRNAITLKGSTDIVADFFGKIYSFNFIPG